MANSTFDADLPPLPSYTLQPLPSLLPPIPDKFLSLLFPIAAYWIVSLFFHWIDVNDYLPQYRLHTPVELLKRNHATRWEVLRDVLLQQIIQTIAGVVLGMTEPDDVFGKQDYDVAAWARYIRIAQRAVPKVLPVLGINAVSLSQKVSVNHPTVAGLLAGGNYPWLTQTVSAVTGEQLLAPAFADWELYLAKSIYWVFVPGVQFIIAILFVDTWQYFLHRAMHMNKWMYTTWHSRHHRLYVPYAYGALYNHPFEGFLLDTLGAGLAFKVAGLSTRQGMWFFTGSTIKTVDDHCGYCLPWDPLQHLTSNNAAYHDIHHQSWGIKTNFSQPFFTFWDRLLGTVWTGGDVLARYERARISAQRKVDTDGNTGPKSITGTKAADSLDTNYAPYQDELRNATHLSLAEHQSLQPTIPAGKATQQAIGSREQVLDDVVGGGKSVLFEETEEEQNERIALRRSPRKKSRPSTPSSGSLKGLRNRVNDSLVGKRGGILGLEDGR